MQLQTMTSKFDTSLFLSSAHIIVMIEIEILLIVIAYIIVIYDNIRDLHIIIAHLLFDMTIIIGLKDIPLS
jgi:hypothetical protein